MVPICIATAWNTTLPAKRRRAVRRGPPPPDAALLRSPRACPSTGIRGARAALDRHVMLRPGTFALTVLLALVTAIGPVSIDLYLPAMPEIGRLLDAPVSQVQLTISVFLIGFAGGQIVYGPVSDRYGRRPVLLTALVIFCAASLACTIAPDIEWLIAAWIVHGFGASGSIVLARAIIRDVYEGARAGRELSIMAMIMALAPILGPVIGGVVQTLSGWRAEFAVILAAGVIALALV